METVYYSQYQLDDFKLDHISMSYTYLNFLADIGGVFQIVVFVISVLLYEMPKNVSLMKIIKNFYVLKANGREAKVPIEMNKNEERHLVCMSLLGFNLLFYFCKPG
jgi:hypothetical protein